MLERITHCAKAGGSWAAVVNFLGVAHRCGMATTLLDFVKEQAPHLLLPTEGVSELPSPDSVGSCSDEQKVTRLSPQKGITDALWRSRHLPRHLYRVHPRVLSDAYQAVDE